MSTPNPSVERPFVKIDGNDQGYLIHGATFNLSIHFPGSAVVWVHNPLPKTRRVDWPLWARGWHRCNASDQWAGTANYYHPYLRIRTFNWPQFWKSGIFRFELKIDFPNVRPQHVHSHLKEQEINIINSHAFEVISPDCYPSLSISPITLHRPVVFHGLPEPVLAQKPGYIKPWRQKLIGNQINLNHACIEADYPLSTNQISNI